MATQGIISVISENEVVMKVIAGCDGYLSPTAAKAIKAEWPVTPERAYDPCLQTGLGCDDCLVVMDKTTIISKFDEDVGPLYRETFSDPNFNPRWKNGGADNFEIVKV